MEGTATDGGVRLVCSNNERRREVHGEFKLTLSGSVSTQQIYAVVLEIRGAVVARPDIRWAFLQDPVLLEDALGRKFPVPSEYDVSLLDRIIRHKFREGPGSNEVSVGNYQVMYSADRTRSLSQESRLRPGSSLIMSILVSKEWISNEWRQDSLNCPIPSCNSSETMGEEGGGRFW